MNDEILRERLARLRRDNSVYQATPRDVEMVARGDIQAGELVHMGNLGDNTENRNRDAVDELVELTREHVRVGGHGILATIDDPIRDDMIDAHEFAMRQFTGHPREDIRAELEEADNDFWERYQTIGDVRGELYTPALRDEQIEARRILPREFTMTVEPTPLLLHPNERCTASYTNPKPDKVVMTAKKEVVIPRIDKSIR